MSGLVGREQMGWDGTSDHSGEGGSKVVRGDVAYWGYCGLYGGTCVVCRLVGIL